MSFINIIIIIYFMFIEFLSRNKFFNALVFHIKLYAPLYIVLSLPDSATIILHVIHFLIDAAIKIITVRIPSVLTSLENGGLYEWVIGSFFFNLFLSWVLNSIILFLTKKKSTLQKIVITLAFIFFMHTCIYLVIFLYYFSLFIFNCKIYLIVAWLFSSIVWLVFFLNHIHNAYNKQYQKKRNIYFQFYVAFLITCFILGLLCLFSVSFDIIIFFKQLCLYLIKRYISNYLSFKVYFIINIILLLFVVAITVHYVASRGKKGTFFDTILVFLLIEIVVIVLCIVYFYCI